MIVRVYGDWLLPNVDYTVDGDHIVFTNPPRARVVADDAAYTYITYLNGFTENDIVACLLYTSPSPRDE